MLPFFEDNDDDEDVCIFYDAIDSPSALDELCGRYKTSPEMIRVKQNLIALHKKLAAIRNRKVTLGDVCVIIMFAISAMLGKRTN